MTRLETTLDLLSGLDRLNAAPLAGRMEEVLDTVLDNVRDHAGSASDARRSPAIGASRATVRHLPRDAALLLDILAELHGGVLTVRLPDGASLWLGDDQVTGRIRSVTDEAVTIEVDGAEREVPLAEIDKAVVQVEMNRSFEDEEEN